MAPRDDSEEFEDGLPLGRPTRTAPGLVVERRCFLALSAAALAGAGLARPAYARLAPGDALTFDEFLVAVLPEARKLVADTSADGQDAYLRAVAREAVRLGDAPQPSWRDSGQSLGPGTFIGANLGPGGASTEPFVALHWKMDPGTRIEAHAHTHGNVCTLGLEGEALVNNYEMDGARDFDRPGVFRVRRTVRQVLSRGSVNLVNLERNYVHGTIAGAAGARGLDITTRIRPRRPDVPYLRLERAVPGQDGAFEAVWSDLAGMKGEDASLLR